jgi:glycosyltransferase involved in cell wall biosynthesis
VIREPRSAAPHLDDCCLIIPALDPTGVLVDLAARLKAIGFHHIVVIDNGSAPDCAASFEAVAALGAHLIVHARNLGKGCALKSGFRYCLEKKFGAVVTVDADGQHLPDDVLAVANAALSRASLPAQPAAVLGARRFAANMPLRSRVGNTLTQWLFQKLSGVRFDDTQTGLRAFPAALLPRLLQLQGDRYEYEMSVLIDLAASRYPVVEVPIASVYLDGNSSSHFRPLHDSIRVYSVLLRAWRSR